ncbi:MAG: hypothetical protein U5R31_13750 [Acidimicrobiia bacterium]|nr:hypothetical protein [Acidimicrobiia bacterium]
MLEVDYVRGESEPTLEEFRVRPTGEGLATGSSRLLRQLGFGAVEQTFREWLRAGFVTDYIGGGWLTEQRPGRAGRPDKFYAEWAKRYVDALEESPGSPVKYLVDNADEGEFLTDKQVRGYLYQARKRGLLTEAPKGRPGGELTDKAKQMVGERHR